MVWILGSTLLPARAHARPRSFSLNWVRGEGAESCITSRHLARWIEHAVGPVFVLPGEAELSVEGRVERTTEPLGWRARIAVTDAQGVMLGARTISSSQAECRSLNVQIGLVVLLIVDPEISVEHLPLELLESFRAEGDPAGQLLAELELTPPPAAATGEPREEPRPTPTPPSSPPERAPAESSALTVGVSGGVGIGAELLASASAGPWLGLELRASRRWALALRSVLWLPNSAAFERNGRPFAVHFTMSLSTLLGCGALFADRTWTWDVCGGGSVGARWSDASELDRADDTVRWSVGVAASTQLRLELGPSAAVLAAVSVDVPLPRPRFVYRDSGQDHELFTAGRVAPWVSLGAAWSF